MSESDDRFEADRVRRVRASMESTVERLRLREPLSPSALTLAHGQELLDGHVEYRNREDRRIADERAGRATKPFAEMDALEIYFAMASYPGPGRYPGELEKLATEMAAAPLPTLSIPDQEALSEVTSIKHRLQAGEREIWMAERLYEFTKYPSETVSLEAIKLFLELCDEAYSDRPTAAPAAPKKSGPVS